MFVIVNNNSVLLGPMRWNRFRFENEIKEELDVSITLPDKNTGDVISIDENIKIYPVVQVIEEPFNLRTQRLNGPFWQFTDAGAIASYIAEDLSIDAVKNFMKAEVANRRWIKENKGVNVTINNKEYMFLTTKENRNALQQVLTSGLSEINWKIDTDTWIVLSQQQIQTVLEAVVQYVQSCFDWELIKNTEIDNCNTLDSLNNVVIIEPEQNLG